jgi:hypothetical protein
MKTRNTLIAFASLFISISAHAASVAADQTLGEKYESPYLGASKVSLAGNQPLNGPYEFECATPPASPTFSYYVYLPLFRIGPVNIRVPDSPSFTEFAYTYGGGQTRYCKWNTNALERYIKPAPTRWTTSRRGIYLDRMTADGTGMEGRAYIQGKDIAAVTGSGSDSIQGFVTFQLQSCLTDRGDTVEKFSDLEDQTTDVRDMIRNLRTRGYRRFLKCNLSVNPKNYGLETLTDGETISAGYEGKFTQEYIRKEGDYRLGIQTSTPDLLFLTYTNDGAMADQFARQGPPRDTAREQVALKAMNAFVSFINNDYANLLYSLNNAKISQAERNEAIRAFFDKNSSKIKGLLGQVDDNYADVSLMNKVSMMISVQDSYRTIAKVERSITSSSPISLDQVVHQ